MAKGEVREISFDMVMVVIIGMLIGVTGQTIHNNANHSMEDMKKEITDILLNGFRK